MGNFIVSARKYRPGIFKDVVGQEHITLTLKNALQTDHLAHAFLFTGPRGVGKTTTARILAKVLNCEQRTDDFEPCNTCNSCVAFNNNASFNITELDAASNNSVEHIRALIEQVRFQPQQGKYKIFIIDEVHMLSSQAFNAFLKTLEEPPPYAIFILATTEKHKIIPTILSRCQIFDFRRIQVKEIVNFLQEICDREGIKAEEEALHVIAQKADGALRDALSLFDRIVSGMNKSITYDDLITNLNILDYEYYFKLVESLLISETSEILLLFNDVIKNGFEPDIFMTGLGEHIRNLLIAKDEKTISILEMSKGLKDRYTAQAKKSPSSFLLTSLSLINDCDVNYRMARNKQLHVEMALIKMAYINQTVDAFQKGGLNAEKKNPNLSKAQPIVPKKAKINPKVDVVAPNIVEKAVSKVSENTELGKIIDEPKAEYQKGKLSSKLKKNYIIGGIGSVSDTQEAQTPSKLELNIANVQKIWDEFAEQHCSKMVQSTFNTAKLSLDGDILNIEVKNVIAESTITAEAVIFDLIRKNIDAPELTKNVIVNLDKKAKKTIAPKKILNNKEIFIEMRQKNPLVDTFVRNFDLRPEMN